MMRLAKHDDASKKAAVEAVAAPTEGSAAIGEGAVGVLDISGAATGVDDNAAISVRPAETVGAGGSACATAPACTDVRGLVRFACGGVVMLALCAMLLMNGCAAGQTSSADAENSAASVTAAETSGDAVETEYASFEDVAADFDESALDLDYSKRDLDASCDASAATAIMLEGDSATISGSGATASADGVTITAAGTYVVTGELTDGQLLVAAGDDDKVQLVLAGATIHNEDGPAMYVQNAGKCFVTLADGTENTLTDGADYALEADSDEPYATLFSCCDLTLNGGGTLNVTAAYRHAVCSKDDLTVVLGTCNISAVEDGLRGRDSVKIRDGVFSIAAGGDGIKSNKDSKPTKGFVSIDGGTFDIQAGDDAVQAKTLVRVAGGTLAVAANDDAFHSDLEMHLLGGMLTVDAGDDAFHAETKLTVDGGTVNVTSCYEGYEAEKIYVNGGETHIAASDDGVNVSAADLSDSSDTDTTSNTLPNGEAPGNLGAAGAGAGMGKGGAGEEASQSGAAGDGAVASADGATADGAATAGDSAAAGNAAFAGDAARGQRGQGGNAPTPPDDSEAAANGGAPDNAFAEGAGQGGKGGQGGGMAMGDENCLIQINGGYLVVDAAGDGVDSNGSVEVNGGVLLVAGPTSDGDGAFDYDLTATVSGGTVLMVGSTGMAQNFTSGTQAFAMTAASGTAGQTVAVADASGNVVVSFTAAKQFGMVLASSPAFTEGGEYSLVVGGSVEGANADGYTDSGTVSGGSETAITASCTASSGLGGLGQGDSPMAAGQAGDVRIQHR